MAKGRFWRQLRILILLYVLLFVAVGSWLARARTTDWDDSLYVGVYPINGDSSSVSAEYIDRLDAEKFADIEQFMQRETNRYGIDIAQPVRIELGQIITTAPPTPPVDRNPLKVMLWSLKLRIYAWRMQRAQPGPAPDIRMFVLYYDPVTHPVLAHSLGLQKGLIGVVNAFSSRNMAGSNNVVLTHELLHTLGASDKYDPATTHPRFPDGYGEPQRLPLHPQRYAEVMGGRIALSEYEADIPTDLGTVLLGPVTAAEIRLLR